MTAALIRSKLPVIVEHNIATTEETDIDTLADPIFATAGQRSGAGSELRTIQTLPCAG